MLPSLPIKDRLLARRRKLLERYLEELDRAPVLEHPERVASEAASYDDRMLRTLGPTDASFLRELTAAIARVEEGHYGTCVRCHRAIEPLRLESVPMTTVCPSCAAPRRPRTI